MPDPDVLRCPGCGTELRPTLDALTGALRCERCGLAAPIPHPATPTLYFDEPPPLPDEPPPLPPTTLGIEYWFQDAPKPSEEPRPPVIDEIAPEPFPPADLEVAEAPSETEARPPREPESEPPDLPSASTADEAPPPSPAPSERLELTIVEEPLPGVPLLPTPTVLAPVEDAAPADDIPVVQPRPAPVAKARPVAADRPKPPITVTRPREDDPPRPKPQLGLALAVMAILLLVVVVGISVIGYAIWTGLRSASRPRTEAAPAVWTVAVSDRSVGAGPLSISPSGIS